MLACVCRPLLALALTAALAGCVSLANRIAQPRTQSGGAKALRLALMIEAHAGIGRTVLVARGGHRIVYHVVPAADFHMRYVYGRVAKTAHGRESAHFHFVIDTHPVPVPVRGTVIFLHGWGDSHAVMLPWALALSRHGYVGILPDLRNHGQSDRAPAGYGKREAEDVVELIADLRRRGSLPAPVYLFGESLGATTAVFAAADPAAKVDGTIAMEPFVNAGKAIRGMIAFVSRARHGVGDALASLALPDIDDPHVVDAAVRAAGVRLHLDLDALDIGPLLRHPTTCTLLLTGTHDLILDAADLRAFANAPKVRYLELAKENHLTLPLRVDWLADPIADWLAHASACPSLALPAEPVSAAAAH